MRVIIYCEVNIDVISLIGRYCHRIKSVYDFNKNENDMSFFLNYGHKLEELYKDSEEVVMKQILEFCPNLKKIYLHYE